LACDERGPQPAPAPRGASSGSPGVQSATRSADGRPDSPADTHSGMPASKPTAGMANGVAGEVAFAGDDEQPIKVTGRERPSVPMRTDEFHLDQSEPPALRAPAASRPPAVERRPIHIKLLSTPSGALAAVDGTPVGRTPAFWQGEFTGMPREFTFVLPGHAMARYRFVPTTSGVIHGTLVKIAAEPDARHDHPPPAAPERPRTDAGP